MTPGSAGSRRYAQRGRSRDLQRISRDRPRYWLDHADVPVARVVPGERFVVETLDCRSGTIISADQVAALPDLSKVNPVTGPISVDGLEAGQCLRVHIHGIRVSDRGLMLVRAGVTVFDDVASGHIRIAEVDGGGIDLGAFKLVAMPMIGVIGVAPSGEPLSTGKGARCGGNMDTRLIGEGADVYLTAEVDGGGLYLGDLHAAMGDGEVFLTGVEVAGEVEVSVEVIPAGVKLPTPIVETPELLAVIAEGDTLDAASIRALHDARTLIVRLSGLSEVDAGFFLSAACDLRVCQFVPGSSIHARVEIPKTALALNGFVTDVTAAA